MTGDEATTNIEVGVWGNTESRASISMISYAQNFEDVILERVFRGNSGIYIDVGACHPVWDSVTKHFYNKGWSGLCIDPRPGASEEFRAERPRDQFFAGAAGKENGVCAFLPSADSIARGEIANHTELYHNADTLKVPCMKLCDLISKYFGRASIDFMTIDVEGAEADVLTGLLGGDNLPKVLVVEAIDRETRQPSHDQWEHQLSGIYSAVGFDGVNRFYCKAELAASLAHHFTVPPCIWDRSVSYSSAMFWRGANVAEVEAVVYG